MTESRTATSNPAASPITSASTLPNRRARRVPPGLLGMAARGAAVRRAAVRSAAAWAMTVILALFVPGGALAEEDAAAEATVGVPGESAPGGAPGVEPRGSSYRKKPPSTDARRQNQASGATSGGADNLSTQRVPTASGSLSVPGPSEPGASPSSPPSGVRPVARPGYRPTRLPPRATSRQRVIASVTNTPAFRAPGAVRAVAPGSGYATTAVPGNVPPSNFRVPRVSRPFQADVPDVDGNVRDAVRGIDWRVTRKLGEGAFGAALLVENPNDPAALSVVKHVKVRTDRADAAQVDRMVEDLARESALQNLAAGRSQRFVASRIIAGNRMMMPVAGEADLATRISDLSAGLKAGRISEAQYRQAVKRVALDLVDATAAMQDAGVSHNDLKPDNIRIDARGRLTVLDFGLATAPGETIQQNMKARPMWPIHRYAEPAVDDLTGDVVRTPRDTFSAARILEDFTTGEPNTNRNRRVPVDRSLSDALGADFADFVDQLGQAQSAAALRNHRFLAGDPPTDADVEATLTAARPPLPVPPPPATSQ